MTRNGPVRGMQRKFDPRIAFRPETRHAGRPASRSTADKGTPIPPHSPFGHAGGIPEKGIECEKIGGRKKSSFADGVETSGRRRELPTAVMLPVERTLSGRNVRRRETATRVPAGESVLRPRGAPVRCARYAIGATNPASCRR